MLSENEKREMLADARNRKRGRELEKVRRLRCETSTSLNDYIAFLTAVQDIKPFTHQKKIPQTHRNLL